jgi:RND superfamily putative drug exporter
VFNRLGHWTYRYRRLTLTGSALVIIVSAIVGFSVFPRLGSEGFNDPASDSAQVAVILEQQFDSPESNMVIALLGPDSVDSDSSVRTASALEEAVASVPGVLRTMSYWGTKSADLRSADGLGGLVLVTFDPSAASSERQITDDVQATVEKQDLATTSVYIGGGAAIAKAINTRISEDLARAEAIAIPVTFVLLLIVFGGLVAAGMPLLVGVGSIVGSLFVLFLVTYVTDISVFSINVVTGLGLGLGIDYSLLVVSRFREELASGGRSVEDALARTVASAGRTVVFSGLTVAVTLAAMLFFPQYFLKSFAYAGIAAVAFAVLGAIITLPAALGLLGPRVNALRIRRGVGRSQEGTRWATLASAIMRRPWPVAIGSVALLLVLAWPALSVQFSQVDERALPRTDPSVIATDVLRNDFPGLGGVPIEITLPRPSAESSLADYSATLSKVPTVTRVVSSSGVFSGGALVSQVPPGIVTASADTERMTVFSTERSRSPEGERVIAGIRAVAAPAGTMVGGLAAEYTDSQQGIARMLPWALGWVIVSVLILLFLFTGSILLPIKAVILNVLSLAAAIGVLVWVFQEGHLTWLVGDFVNTGSLDTSTIIVTAIVAFGLSMDYEVFLLSRIKEEYDRTGDNAAAVAIGLQRSAGIITAAALLLAVVFATFLTCSVTSIKMIGLGVTVAILLDATVVRVLLVPAFMRIAGRANWWAPAPLRRVHERFGISDH